MKFLTSSKKNKPFKANLIFKEILKMKLKDLKQGDYFILQPIAEPKESQVYIRGEYDRSTKKYICGKFIDISYSRLFDGNKEVYTDFTF